MGVLTSATVPGNDTCSSTFRMQFRELLKPLPLGMQVSLAIAVTIKLIAIVDTDRRRRIEELNAEQRGKKSWHLPPVKATPNGRPVATVPCWHGRQAWLSDVARELETQRATHVRVTNGRVAAKTVVAAASAHAHFAETRTGRHMVASLGTIAKHAGLSIDQVKRARRVLRHLGLLVDLQLGRPLTGIEIQAARDLHGHTQIGAASEIALTTPARIASSRPIPVPQPAACASAPLSRSGLFSVSELAKKRRTQRKKSSKTTTTAEPARPRPISLQRVTAQLVSMSRGLDQSAKYLKKSCYLVAERPANAPVRHLGALCDAIAGAGIDTDRFTARHIKDALDLDGRVNGLSWPDRIANPAKYLAWRLRRIDWTGPTPTERATEDRRLARQTVEKATQTTGFAASSEQRATARRLFVDAQKRKRQERQDNNNNSATIVNLNRKVLLSEQNTPSITRT